MDVPLLKNIAYLVDRKLSLNFIAHKNAKRRIDETRALYRNLRVHLSLKETHILCKIQVLT